MSIEYVRKSRGVPAKRGMRVFYRHASRYGTITGTHAGNLLIRLDGDKYAGNYHPTWELNYLDDDGNVIFESPESK